MGKIERHQLGRRLSPADQMPENLPGSRTDVQDHLVLRDVEFSRADQMPHQGFVERNHAAQSQDRAGRVVVKIANAATVLADGKAVDAFEFKKSAQGVFSSRAGFAGF